MAEVLKICDVTFQWMMESKKQATSAQITALMDFMQENPELSKGLLNSGLEREELEAQWRELATTLNNMGGSVKSVEKWKQVSHFTPS